MRWRRRVPGRPVTRGSTGWFRRPARQRSARHRARAAADGATRCTSRSLGRPDTRDSPACCARPRAGTLPRGSAPPSGCSTGFSNGPRRSTRSSRRTTSDCRRTHRHRRTRGSRQDAPATAAARRQRIFFRAVPRVSSVACKSSSHRTSGLDHGAGAYGRSSSSSSPRRTDRSNAKPSVSSSRMQARLSCAVVATMRASSSTLLPWIIVAVADSNA